MVGCFQEMLCIRELMPVKVWECRLVCQWTGYGGNTHFCLLCTVTIAIVCMCNWHGCVHPVQITILFVCVCVLGGWGGGEGGGG